MRRERPKAGKKKKESVREEIAKEGKEKKKLID